MALKSTLRRLFPELYVVTRGMKLLYSSRSFLKQSGYVESIRQHQPLEEHGDPIPWMNYQVIHFLRTRLRQEHHLFEYGSGFSTEFYAGLVGKVVSVEHDTNWFKRLQQSKPDNVEVIYRDIVDIESYCSAAKQQGENYDIIVVDGRERVRCIKSSVEQLTTRGVIILDDSARERYREGMTFLRQRGFKQLDFIGLKPGGISTHQTTIFYRPDNCLDL